MTTTLLRRDWGFKAAYHSMPLDLKAWAARDAARVAFSSTRDPQLRLLVAHHVFLMTWGTYVHNLWERFWAHALYLNDHDFPQTVGWLMHHQPGVLRQYHNTIRHIGKLEDMASRAVKRRERLLTRIFHQNPFQPVENPKTKAAAASSSFPCPHPTPTEPRTQPGQRTGAVSGSPIQPPPTHPQTRSVSERSLPEASARAAAQYPQTRSVSERSLPEASARAYPRPPPQIFHQTTT